MASVIGYSFNSFDVDVDAHWELIEKFEFFDGGFSIIQNHAFRFAFGHAEYVL